MRLKIIQILPTEAGVERSDVTVRPTSGLVKVTVALVRVPVRPTDLEMLDIMELSRAPV